MSIRHATVATDPQVPKLKDTDWNADHTAPTLAEVLAAGNDPGGHTIGNESTGTYLQLPAGMGSGASLNGADNDPDTGPYGAQFIAFGGQAADGADAQIYVSDALAGSGGRGGDFTLRHAVGDGAGRDGLVFLNLPTSDPGVPGALYSLAGVVKVSP